ncbi:2-oxo acid dehydrogenase subunit E2, partial [Patescibacteria group bacterium]|nr:2-oxo acid dehydrogenase subunit E2 [Patescibacteria group bacterium]
MNNVGKYEKIPFPKGRELVIDVVSLERVKHHFPILFELDVSRARDFIRKYKLETGKQISFTGWIAKCIAMAVSEHPYLHALRHGNRSLILFNDIDILVTVQKQIDENEIPLPCIIRKANLKSVYEINDEIRTAQNQSATTHDMVLGKNPWFTRIYPHLPKSIRYAMGRILLQNPFGIKR